MERIDIKKSDLENKDIIGKGIEANIFKWNDLELFKIYYDYDKPYFEKTKKKIKLFDNIDIPNIAMPQKEIYIDNVLAGYSMYYYKGYKKLSEFSLKTQEKIKILEQLYEIIKNFHHNNMIYGDISENNILYNGEEIVLCDVLQCKIKDTSFSEITKKMKDYMLDRNIDTTANISYKMDIYLFNLFTITFLNNIPYEEIENKAEEILYNMSHNKNVEQIIGMTDNLECLDICLRQKDKEIPNDILLDKINKEQIKIKEV